MVLGTCDSHPPGRGRHPQLCSVCNALPNSPDLRMFGSVSHNACAVISAGLRVLHNRANRTAQLYGTSGEGAIMCPWHTW